MAVLLPLLPLGVLSVVGVGVGVGVSQARDLGTRYSGLMMPDNANMMGEDVRLGLSVVASSKVGDRHALWSSPSWPEKREVEGSLDGFPDVDHHGIMKGVLDFVVPGVDTAVAGTWIAVDENLASNETQAALHFLMDLLTLETKPVRENGVWRDLTLEQLLWVANETLAEAAVRSGVE